MVLEAKEELGQTIVHQLKTSLSQTLDYFSPLAGPFATIELEYNTSSFFIDCSNAGVLFVHAAANRITIFDRGGGEEGPRFQRWFPNGFAGLFGFHDFIPPCLQVRFFHFTKESIANLKTKANAEVGTDKISSLQALLSYIWRTVIRCKNLDPVEETNLFLPVSAKSRLHQLSQQYIGNAMLGGVITMKVKDLLEKGLRNAAWETNKSISSV
ncbi:Uncharacterized protein TCM_031508 [Theobroma cacao]|uniref:HXXXD-type acyl-transferase family protein n=1 Tax=Theobroma cacao TaxID=3641 RepID=A0A061FET9_THECC|nr:Uncharacterized protein TCM_031508 [Theobroma cacao]